MIYYFRYGSRFRPDLFITKNKSNETLFYCNVTVKKFNVSIFQLWTSLVYSGSCLTYIKIMDIKYDMYKVYKTTSDSARVLVDCRGNFLNSHNFFICSQIELKRRLNVKWSTRFSPIKNCTTKEVLTSKRYDIKCLCKQNLFLEIKTFVRINIIERYKKESCYTNNWIFDYQSCQPEDYQ